MSIKLDTESLKSSSTEATLHHLPCRIEHDGVAEVDRYFTSGIREGDHDKEMVASFRGRPLHGQHIEVPSGYTGLIFNERSEAVNEDEDRVLKISHKFDKFTSWNLDCPPSENDKLKQALNWIDIAKAVHSPVGSD